MMTKTEEIKELLNPITAEKAVAAFLEDPENERLFRESEIRLEIAEHMRHLRKSQGITQEKLAERVGCSQPFIAKLEKGAYERFGLSNLRTYARALGYDINVKEMFQQLVGAIFTGSSSSDRVREALEYEEQLSPKLATAFSLCPVPEKMNVNDGPSNYDSAA